MKKLKMEPGRKYRGTAWINEYGEIQFRPEQKGTKPNNMSVVLEHEEFTIYESKDLFKVTFKFPKIGLTMRKAWDTSFFAFTQLKVYVDL